MNIVDNGRMYFHCFNYTIEERYVSIRRRSRNLLHYLSIKDKYRTFRYDRDYFDKS